MKQLRIRFSPLGVGMLWFAILVGPNFLHLSEATGDDSKIAASKESPKWSQKMQTLYQTLGDLLTDVTSDRRYGDPANRSRIDHEAQKLAVLAHDLTDKGMIPPDNDPTLQIVAKLLGAETKRAVIALKNGDRVYARGILRSVPTYCIACHTRNATGPQLGKLSIEPMSAGLTAVERGEFFTATRQFDRALDEFKKVVSSTRPKSDDSFDWTRDWQRAVQQALVISIRVKKDPAQALEIVQTVLDSKGAPSFMKEDAKAWKISILDWKQEAPRQAQTEEGLRAEAIRLMTLARQTQKYPMDRTADVIYLRASSAAHDFLQSTPKGSNAAEALLLAGITYEILSPLKLEDLHSVYYEACIRKAPHSSVADTCYRRLEESVYQGYTGSAGTQVPEDARQHLSELRALSLVPLEQTQAIKPN